MGGSGAPGSTAPLLLSSLLKWGSLEADGQLIVPSESVSWLVREAVRVISLHLLRRYRVLAGLVEQCGLMGCVMVGEERA